MNFVFPSLLLGSFRYLPQLSGTGLGPGFGTVLSVEPVVRPDTGPGTVLGIGPGVEPTEVPSEELGVKLPHEP